MKICIIWGVLAVDVRMQTFSEIWHLFPRIFIKFVMNFTFLLYCAFILHIMYAVLC